MSTPTSPRLSAALGDIVVLQAAPHISHYGIVERVLLGAHAEINCFNCATTVIRPCASVRVMSRLEIGS